MPGGYGNQGAYPPEMRVTPDPGFILPGRPQEQWEPEIAHTRNIFLPSAF